jgi:DNA replication and repair protein RecF
VQPLTLPSETAARIAVRRLSLTDFRCYPSLGVETDGRPVALFGPNGAGKTNLLEALSFLVPGRGLRRARLDDATRRTPGGEAAATGWAVWAAATGSLGEVEIGTGLVQDGGTGRRTVRINGAPAQSQTALGEWIAALWLTPEMERLFADGASSRRRFLDRLVLGFDPAHAERTAAYDRAMQDRDRGAQGADAAWLDALETRMAENGVAVAVARNDLVARLGAAVALGVGPFPAAALALEGEVEGWASDGPALRAEDRFRDELARRRAIDAEAGRTTVGVHRSDLAVRRLADGIPAAQCSTGEQKALLISLILANARLMSIERGIVPMLLLDEIAAHLDPARRTALFDEICALDAQAWMTGTDAALFEPLGERAMRFRVENAALAPH